MTLSKRQLTLLSLAIFCLVTGYLCVPKLAAWSKPLGNANSSLMASSDMLFLESYLTCFLTKPQCRRAYSEIVKSGQPFPFEFTMLFFFSLGFLALAFFMYRPKPRLYDGSLAVREDVKDLRTKNWLDNPKVGTSLILGTHVTVPETGEARKKVLRGHSRKGIDNQMMVVKPNYGGRSELPLGAVFGTTRSGKTMHLTAQALRWTDSFIALDIKGEIYDLTAGVAAARAGKERVVVLSPEGKGHQYDPFAELMDSENGISTAANLIAAPHEESGNGKYFAEKAAQGLEAAFHAARFAQQPPFDFLYELILAGGMGSFYGRLKAMDSDQVQLALNKFLDPHGGKDFDLQRALNESSLTNSWSTMVKSLNPFLGDNVRWLLRRSDFRARDLMKKPTYVYLQFPETTLEATSRVYDLIVTALTKGMFDYVGKELKRQKPSTRVLLLLDELYAAPVTNLPHTYSTAAGRFITPILYCQSLEQLDELYNTTGRKTILGNCGVTLYYKTETFEMAKYISELTGKVSRTEQRRSRRWRPLPGFEVPTISEGNQSREVISPEEVNMIGGEKREVIAVKVTGKPLTIVRRVDPYKTRRLKKLMKKYPAPEIRVANQELTSNHPYDQRSAFQHSPHQKSSAASPSNSKKTNTKGFHLPNNEPSEGFPEVRPEHPGSVMTSLEARGQAHAGKGVSAEASDHPTKLPGGLVQPPLDFSAEPNTDAKTARPLSIPAVKKESRSADAALPVVKRPSGLLYVSDDEDFGKN